MSPLAPPEAVRSRGRVSERTIGRLCIYRRLLFRLQREGAQYAYSHEIARAAAVSPPQVRRDLMLIGYSGSPNRGYSIAELGQSLGEFLDDPEGQNVALVGVGNLGRAVLNYFAGRRPRLAIVAAFDSDPEKHDRVIHGCRIYPMESLATVVAQQDITVGIIAVPATVAQTVVNRLQMAGVRGLLNFAPVPLHTTAQVFTENIDMTMALEKVAFFARHERSTRKPNKAETL